MPRTTRNSLETADACDLEALATSRSIEESSLPETPPKAQVQTSGLKAYTFTLSSTNYTTNEHQFVVSETRPHQTIRPPHAQETEFLPPNPSSSPQQYLSSRTEQIISQHAYPDPYHPTFTAERDPEVLEAARTLLDIYYSAIAIPAEREADESRQSVGSSFVLTEPVPPTDTPCVEADANGSSGGRWFSATPWLRRRPRPVSIHALIGSDQTLTTCDLDRTYYDGRRQSIFHEPDAGSHQQLSSEEVEKAPSCEDDP